RPGLAALVASGTSGQPTFISQKPAQIQIGTGWSEMTGVRAGWLAVDQSGQIRNAVSDRIFRWVASLNRRARKSSRFFFTSGTPGPGQSVPNRVLAAISSS